MSEERPEPDQALAVNVSRRRWREITAGHGTEADVVLGAWSPWKGGSTTIRHFDPDRIAVIVACRRGETMAVYDVLPSPDGQRWHWVGDGPRRRIVFHGQPSTRFAAQLRAPAPTWKAGEGNPVKVIGLGDLLQDDEAPERDNPDPQQRHAVIGQAVVALADGGHLTVSVPPEYSVTVTTRTPRVRSH
ncbi:hypothetical protein [Streptomyces qinglanensis]|uniref:hypothetical protein n=1 Tax=Streptomyces qinglanensis TaxID=943816 RepID=UPI003D73F201